MLKQGQLFDPKDGPPKLAEEQVVVYQQLVGLLTDPKRKAAAQAALDARDAQKLQAILGGRKDAY